jgi:hypothetical protein
MMVAGDARLMRSAVNPLVSTGTSPLKKLLSVSPWTAYSRPVPETNKGKRFEDFPQALAVFIV